MVVDGATRLGMLLRLLPDIYFRLDAGGRIVEWHAGREVELHVPPEHFIGKRPGEVLPAPAAQLISAAVTRARDDAEVVMVEYVLPTPSGDDQFEARLIGSGDGEVTVLVRNTTARRRAEAALQATEDRLRASQKLEAVGQLAGGVAHDFNNLLTVILGRLTFLKRSAALDDADRDHVYEAFDATSHAATLTRQLLAFSRRQVMAPVVFSIDDVIEPLRNMVEGVVGEHIEVTLALEAASGFIDADPTQIEQVLLNLVLNARDAMSAVGSDGSDGARGGGGSLVIATSDEQLEADQAQLREDARPGPHVVLRVSDTGCGMGPEVMARLFEPFFTTKPPGEGTGLGLATLHGVVKQSNGHAVVRSELGVGSTFELWFPRATRSAALVDDSTSSSVPVGDLRGAGERILVVEDEDGLRRLVVEILSNAGYSVRSVPGGVAALRAALEEDGEPALLLTDVVMPVMGGRELARRVREARPGVRVLLMSGHDAGGRGSDLPILEKPFAEDVLLAKVREVLGAR